VVVFVALQVWYPQVWKNWY